LAQFSSRSHLVPDRLRTAGGNLRADVVTVSVAARFEERGIPYLLLKGPAIANWLYGPGERGYGDCDFLVSPSHIQEAVRVLQGLGFVPPVEGGWSFVGAHGTWSRADGSPAVDLHRRIWGSRVSPERTWEEVFPHKSVVHVLGKPVATMDIVGQALHIAMHAALHAGATPQVQEDLRRAIKTPGVDWVRVLGLADRLDARDALAAGLSLQPAGRALMKGLRLPMSSDLEMQLRLREGPAVALHIAELRQLRGGRRKLRSAMRRVFPTPEYMREYYDVTSTERMKLVRSYIKRLRTAAAQLYPSVVLLIQVRRSSLTRNKDQVSSDSFR
jgi:hypothetical protein